jgi:hypothetical protein
MPKQEPKCILSWFIPASSVSEANRSEHWTKRYKRNKQQKAWIYALFKTHMPNLELPVTVRLTRFSKKKLDEHDNLPMSMKYFCDAIADRLIPGLRPGIADSDPRITWKYAQEISERQGIKIEFFRG